MMRRDQGPVRVKRCHGLGNVLLLLPLLDHLRARGRDVLLATRREWVETVQELDPGIEVVAATQARVPDMVDLDFLSQDIRPDRHRTLEFAHMLGLPDGEGDIPARIYQAPAEWARPFSGLARATVFAPEAGHPAREWPPEHTAELCGLVKEQARDETLVITGLEKNSPLACTKDLRGELSLKEMLGLLSLARRVITMDSGALHMAVSLGLPTVALFGGVDPAHRVRPGQKVVVLQADRECAPCDKNETCHGEFPCLRQIRPGHVLEALDMLDHIDGLKVLRVRL